MKKAPLTKKTRTQNRPQTSETDFDTGQLLAALMAFKRGDFSARLPEDWIGVPGKIADTFNAVIETNQRMARELERIGRVVGKEGRGAHYSKTHVVYVDKASPAKPQLPAQVDNVPVRIIMTDPFIAY